ncbi:MAG TPA: hypothetical protein VKU41_26425 [Polyangiaceae bacterium]|nr:hypothetical protein [Polyangiaceae bacterium]
MLYRRSPLQSPRLLLRIVAGAGVGALVGAAGCSSSTSTPSPTDAGPAADAPVSTGPCGGGVCGSMIMPSAEGGSTPEAGDGGSGSPAPSDAAAEATLGHPMGVLPFQPDAQGACGGGPCGVMIMPRDGGID